MRDRALEDQAAHDEPPTIGELALSDWRREVFALYQAVRTAPSPQDGHALWRERRDRLFRDHPQSPLPADDPLRASGLPYAPFDPRLRFELPITATPTTATPITATPEPTRLTVATGGGETTHLRRIGSIDLPQPLGGALDVWWLAQYGGGLFLPVRDATAGQTSYGGGRYLLDTVKGADLGARGQRLVLDFNFLYHPSCRYDDAWVCPLAPAGNRLEARIEAGEIL